MEINYTSMILRDYLKMHNSAIATDKLHSRSISHWISHLVSGNMIHHTNRRTPWYHAEHYVNRF